MRVEQLTCHIGAELCGVQLADAAHDAGLFAEIRAQLLRHKVLFLRNQEMSRSDHVTFARRFGELEDHPVAGSDPDHPGLVRIYKSPEVPNDRYENAWHTDATWREQPPMGCVLRCVECPPVGGDTMWANMALAYENVAEWDRARPLWAKLAQDPKLGPTQRAYALFYMARASYEKGDMERTNIWGQEALSLLMQVTPDDKTRLKDTVQLLLESTVRTKRYEAALGWLAELNKYLVPGDAEWQNARFREAEIHKAMGNTAKWRAMMTELAQKYPKSLHGRLASSALSSQKIEEAARKYVN